MEREFTCDKIVSFRFFSRHVMELVSVKALMQSQVSA